MKSSQNYERVSPGFINSLSDNEIFVFGSNLQGHHGGGAALIAYEKFGAVWNEGVGLHGKTYAIPTMHGGVDDIKNKTLRRRIYRLC